MLPPGVLVGIGALSLSVPLFGLALLAGPDRLTKQVRANLRRWTASDRPGTDGAAPPGALTVLARRLTPPASVRRIEQLLARAGRPAGWPVERLLVAKLVLPVVAAALGVLFIWASNRPALAFLPAIMVVLGYFVPEVLLYGRGQERSKQIGLELADTLDQMTIAVEAGLGFEAAMSRTGRNGTGALAQELVRTLQEIQMGHSRRDAYLSLARRANVPDLGRFVRAVLQADAYGIAVADVLRTQAAEMRLKRRQRAEEQAMKIPVKVLFPLMFCILPCLFIVLLGPSVLNIMALF
jgi:tight adherence protein C